MEKTAAEQLRAIADLLEGSGVTIERVGAAGNDQIVVLSFYMSEGGSIVRDAINRPHVKQQRLRKSKDDKTEELKL